VPKAIGRTDCAPWNPVAMIFVVPAVVPKLVTSRRATGRPANRAAFVHASSGESALFPRSVLPPGVSVEET
jgi:hypothetical protein